MKLVPRLKPAFGFQETVAILTPSRNRIAEYEEAFAKKFECRYGVMFSHGRSGLYALLKSWKLQNSEVICPAYTCVVVQHAIVLSDNIPVFVDCAKGSFNMDYEGIEASITENTRAIVVTHLFGYAMDVRRIEKIIRAAEQRFGNKIYVIQDVAHSYGTKWQGEIVTKFGDAAFFGSNISKILSSVFGGMVITNSKETENELRSYRDTNFKKIGSSKTIKRMLYYFSIRIAFNSYVYAFTNWMERKGFLDRFTKYFNEFKIDFPDDWDQLPCNLEAKVGLVQLKKYDAIIEKRQSNAQYYCEKFKDTNEIEILQYDPEATYSHVVALVDNRDEWIEKYRKRGVQLGILVEYSVPELSAYEKYRRGDYPIAKSYANRTINFPNWPGMKLKS